MKGLQEGVPTTEKKEEYFTHFSTLALGILFEELPDNIAEQFCLSLDNVYELYFII